MKLRKQHAEQVLLLVPLFLAFFWMGSLVLNTGGSGTDQLAPSRTAGLVTALFIFILVYSVLLAVLFWSMSRSLKDKSLEGLLKK